MSVRLPAPSSPSTTTSRPTVGDTVSRQRYRPGQEVRDDCRADPGGACVLAEDQRPVPDVVVLRDTSPDSELSNFPAELVVLVAEVVSRSSRSDDRFRNPARYARAGTDCYLQAELDPLHVAAYRSGPDGFSVEAGRAEPGEILTLDEPFPITIDPATPVR